MMVRSRWLLWGLVLPVLVFARGSVATAHGGIEASMLVTGEIAVNPDGSVYGYTLDHRDQLPAPVIKLIEQALPHWQFKPVEVDGRPVLAKALMSLRVVARPIDAGHDAIRIERAAFGAQTAQAHTPARCAKDTCLTYLHRQRPKYPPDLLDHFVSGTVYLAVEVDGQGKVARTAVEQVDLRKLGSDPIVTARWRRELGQASLDAVRGWTFQVPRASTEAGKDHWIVTAPINFAVGIAGERMMIGLSKYGQWDAYFPGPVHSVPWAGVQRGSVASGGGADAVPDHGAPFVADSRFVLLTPIGDPAANRSPQAAPGRG